MIDGWSPRARWGGGASFLGAEGGKIWEVMKGLYRGVEMSWCSRFGGGALGLIKRDP